MKPKMLRLPSIALFLILQLQADAQQDFQVPVSPNLEVKEDYANYEKDIIAAAKWLEETDLDKEKEKRGEVAQFIVKWITGSPSVSVTLDAPLQKLIGKNSDLLIIYLASYSRYVLEHKDSQDKFGPTRAAVMSIMNVYKKGIQINKSKEMDKAIKQADSGNLDAYIREKFGV